MTRNLYKPIFICTMALLIFSNSNTVHAETNNFKQTPTTVIITQEKKQNLNKDIFTDEICGTEEISITDSKEVFKETSAEHILTKEEKEKLEEEQRIAEEKRKEEERLKQEEAKKAEEERLLKERAEKLQAEINNGSVNSNAFYIAQPLNNSSSTTISSGSITPIINTAAVHSYPWGQCTWGVKAMANWAGDYWGNGGQWGYSAAAAGFRTGTVPEVGAIISWDDGGYGHVAYVVAVDAETGLIQVMEANFGGSAEAADPRGIGNYRGWFNPHAWGRVTYIYPN